MNNENNVPPSLYVWSLWMVILCQWIHSSLVFFDSRLRPDCVASDPMVSLRRQLLSKFSTGGHWICVLIFAITDNPAQNFTFAEKQRSGVPVCVCWERTVSRRTSRSLLCSVPSFPARFPYFTQMKFIDLNWKNLHLLGARGWLSR